ncbi:hypothetical protein IVB46_40390 [Bradyrhizobium sp. 61]|uniref:hypothetical protein n=1 Tax=Bradyrhizobium sp. 61 TaxID=2782679 RepID=UPI001FFB832A|nr:hypothetical protein [Bradyrhizobium sp. 61]MCK1281496.1 hypothetical protein [Bradyrhizobium sp. 61]
MVDRTRWEYKVVDMAPGNDKQAEVRLNTWGSAGWEVVAVSVQFTSHFVWMKRQVSRTDQ